MDFGAPYTDFERLNWFFSTHRGICTVQAIKIPLHRRFIEIPDRFCHLCHLKNQSSYNYIVMNKKIILTFLSLLFCAASFAQGKIDPRTILLAGMHKAGFDHICDSTGRRVALMPANRDRNQIEVLITLDREMDEDELVALGVDDPCIVSTIATGCIDMNGLAALEACPDVIGVSIPGRAKLHCDMARADAGVDILRAGDNLPQAYDGTGVVVSLFDQGIEPGHINFLTADRKASRVKRIWQYETTQNEMGNLSTKETSFITQEEIAEYYTDDSTLTHGTHTLGIMAGSFGVNKEDPAYDYSGMAPGADILIGCGSLYYSNVLRAIKRFYEYAAVQSKPLVVNLSFGDNIGPHDGTDAFPKALNELAREVPVFMSSGNEGKKPIAIAHTFGEDSTLRTVIVPNIAIRTYLGATWEAATEVQIWSEDATKFQVSTGLWDKSEGNWVFILPLAGEGQASYIANGEYAQISNCENEDFNYLYTNSAIGISTGTDPNNGRYTADIWYLLNKQVNHIDRNIVPALIITGEPGKRIDVYCDGDYNEFSAGRMEGWTTGTANGTISNIACGPNTIAVGSYCSRPFSEASVEGEVSDFTSWGILPDGRILPDILAPGDCIVSSMSTPFTNSDFYSEQAYPAVYGLMYGNDPYYWTLQQGTSQSSPAMAGIAALWLQANPHLTPAEIKEIMIATARPTAQMTPQCGAGKVDAFAGLKEALRLSTLGELSVDSDCGLLFTIGAGSCTVENAYGDTFHVCVYDTVGRLIARYTSSADTRIDISGLASGCYVIEARSAHGRAVQRAML